MAEEPTVGSVLVGRYRLVAPIGGGAMGSVWRAARVDGGGDVAIKLLSREISDRPEIVKRFEREASLVRDIEHEAVCRVYEHAITEGGDAFLAMELLRGRSLADHLDGDEPMTAEALLEVVVRVLGGLEVIHGAGVVHRDLKPDNIFVTADGTPKLIDFGVSKAADAAKLTATGEVLGTPIFMAPEQAEGARGATPASDVYAIGAVLYDALAGCSPFEAESIGMLLLAIAYHDPAPLSELRPGLPDELVQLVHAAMSKSPAERPASAAAMQKALLAILDAHGAALAAVKLTRTEAASAAPPPPKKQPAKEPVVTPPTASLSDDGASRSSTSSLYSAAIVGLVIVLVGVVALLGYYAFSPS